MKRHLALAFLAFVASPIAAQQQGGPFALEETGNSYSSLQAAVDAIGDGEGTVLIAPGTYRQCAVQHAGAIRFAAARPGTAVFRGRTCEGKAALVLRGEGAEVHGLVFEELRVPDGNGAGIRLEQGDLTVTETLFRDSEQGILTSTDPASVIAIDRSTFSGLGRCDRGLDCAHSIYVNGYGRLSITRSRFERGTGGHYVKSRSPQIEITQSSFDDSGGRGTNYMIDLPNGATGRIAGNIFVQGRDKENYSAFIMVAAEGAEQSSDGLAVTGNEAMLVPGVRRDSSFVADTSGDRIETASNRLGSTIREFERR